MFSNLHTKTAFFISTFVEMLHTAENIVSFSKELFSLGQEEKMEYEVDKLSRMKIQRVISLASPCIQHVLVHGKDPLF